MSAEFTDFDRFAMKRALELAQRGLETTQPNPRVGCVFAKRDRIVGEGWHERAGRGPCRSGSVDGRGRQKRRSALRM